ncbi:MAG: hypothetical protein Q9160_004448 [Pyrenula sp. 1 TL-2023]
MTATPPIILKELNEIGSEEATYFLSSRERRVDIEVRPKTTNLWQDVLKIFLPTGFPYSVSPDYINYQIYDSIQAFSSSIAGLLANRAVLEGIGVGDDSASPTAAIYLSILQESMGRLATIIFAHKLGTSLEPECKMWRLAADFLNDTAMLLDASSPMFPKPVRAPLLGLSSVGRALCGVAAGSSKATLSAHFARWDNIGELNAAGSYVVSLTVSKFATWIWLISLLATHLFTNYAAVRSVSMNTLNRQRTNIVFSNFVATGRVLSPKETAKEERIFEMACRLRWRSSTILGYCMTGISFNDFLRAFGSQQTRTGSIKHPNVDLVRVLQLYKDEDYLLWFNGSSRQAVICLKQGVTPQNQVKAWSQALLIAQSYDQQSGATTDANDSQRMLAVSEEMLLDHSKGFPVFLDGLKKAGWQLDKPALETGPGRRLGAKPASNTLNDRG